MAMAAAAIIASGATTRLFLSVLDVRYMRASDLLWPIKSELTTAESLNSAGLPANTRRP